MRKIIALVLAVVMIAAMSVTVFAGEINNDTPTSGEIPVTYNVSKGYAITIPASFPLDVNENDDGTTHGTGTGDVIITKAKLNGGETLKVTVSGTASTVDGCNWMLKDTAETNPANPIGYKIALSGDQTATDLVQATGIVVDYTSDAGVFTEVKTTMSITTNKTNQAGNFEDKLTFVSAVVSAVVAD